MLAVGPVAILPTPVWATTPSSTPFSVTSGAATWAGGGTAGTISQTTGTAVLVWNKNTGANPDTGFNIQAGDLFSFQMPSGGSVLNKVGYTTGGADNAIINGQLQSPNGRVFILANGNIQIGSGASISTAGGLVLSTLAEASDFNYTALGNLALTGTSQGSIALGSTGGTPVQVVGDLSAYSGSISVNNLTVTGNAILNQSASASGTGLVLTAATGPTSAGNLTVVTNNGAVTENAGAANMVNVAGTTTINSGASAVTLTNLANDFGTVNVTNSGANNVSISDANIVSLGTSSVGGDLNVTVVGTVGKNGIATSGAVAVTGNASLISQSVENSGISFASGSSVGGRLDALTAGAGITINTVGNLTVGNITNSATPQPVGGANYAAVTIGGVVVTGGAVTTATVTGGATSPLYTGNQTVTFTSPVAAGAEPAIVDYTGGIALPNTVTVNNGGSGYGAAPTVTIVGGGGTGATATATLTGDTVTAISITAGGAGYTSAPTFEITPPVAGAVAAQGTAVLNGNFLTSVTISNGGVGYGATLPVATVPAFANNAANVSVTTSGALTTITPAATTQVFQTVGATPVALTGGIKSGNTTSLTGGSVTLNGPVADSGSKTTASVKSTAGNIVLGVIGDSAISVTAVGGNITQNAGQLITTSNASNNSSFSAVGNNVTLDQNNKIKDGQPISITAANALITTQNSIVISTANVTNNLTINTTLTGGKSVTLGAGTGIGNATNLTVGGNLFVNTSGAGAISDNPYSTINVFGTTNLTSGSGAISITGPTGVAATQDKFGQFNVNTSGAVTLAEYGTLNLGNIGNVTAPSSLSATSATGGIQDSGTITLAAGTGTGTFTVTAPNAVVLDATNIIPNLVLVGGADSTVTGLGANVVVAAGTASSGNLTVGTASGFGIILSNVSTTGNLTLNSGNWIDVRDNANIAGNLTMNATGNVAPTAAQLGNFFSPAPNSAGINTVTFTVDAANGNVTGIKANNLQGLTFSSAPAVVIPAPATAGATATAVANLNSFGQISNFTVTSLAGAGYTATQNNTTVTSISGGTSTTSISESGGTLTVGGTTSIASSGNAMLFRGNDFNTVVLNNSTGGGIINDINNVTLSGSSFGAVNVTAGANGSGTIGSSVAGIGTGITVAGTAPVGLANAWALTLGNLTVNALNATAANGGGGNSGTITQSSGSVLHVDNLGAFSTSSANITIANAGNSIGPVSLSGNTITYTEDGTVKLQKLSSGNATITSRTGSIIEDTVVGSSIAGNIVTLNATNGSISIGNTTQTTVSTTGNVQTVVATTPNGSVAVLSSGANLTLGNIVANSLTATATGGNIAQSGTLNIFGAASFTATRNITVTSNTNNFGPVTLVTTGTNNNIAINEGGTLNLRKVTMPGGGNGTFTATSVNGDMIDSGLGGVIVGGSIVGGVATTGSGIASLTAANGNITITNPTSDFPTTGGLVFNAKNVTLSVLGQGGYTLALGAANTTSVAGNLTVSSALGDIGNAGNITVTGDASFQSGGTKNIALAQSGNSFGTLKFAGNSVSIQQTGNMQIVTGSQAIGPANLATNSGSISIVNRGGLVTFGNTAVMTASGNITLPKLISAVGTLTVNASGTKDLSALSVAGDLSGKQPNNLGTGAYVSPLP
jgi:hypothetical protein